MALCTGILFLAAVVVAAPPGGAASWPKTVSDEFTGATIDTAKWSYGSLPWGGQHHNDQYSSWITAADSYQTNGSLILRCRQAAGGEFGGYPYSEGFVHSNGKMNYTYGYVEIRAKFPLGAGTWPAFWTLSSGWPPEFDIAELFGGGDDRMHMGLAYGSSSWDSSNFYQSSEAFQNWHTYGLEWGPGYALWYKDGSLKKSIYQSYVPSVSMYVMLNSGMRYSTNASTPIPNYFEVDYFRKFDPPAAVVNDNTTGTGLNQFNYTGAWSYSSQSGAFFNDNHYSSTVNAYYQVQFNGTRVDLYGARASNHGIAAVSLDGGAETLVDLYAASRADKVLLWSTSGLVYGTHTLKVRVTGTKNAGSTGTAIIADRVDAWNTVANLTGTIIGTLGTFGGGNTREKAMDGNLNTFFDGPTPDDNWLGLDLGGNLKKITKVLYCPRSTYAARMTGGKFQGANLADFSDAIDLFTVATAPEEGALITQTITVTNGFRYVRYLAPAASNGNVSEVEFYGTDVGAANGTWSSAGLDGSWSDGTKWSGGNIASSAGFTADFSTLNLTANRTVTLDASRSIGTLKFGDTSGVQAWNLTSGGGSILTLDSGSGTSPSIVVNQNSVTIAAPLAGANGFTKSGAGTLILSGNNPLSGPLYVDTSSTTVSAGSVRIANSAAIASVASPIYIRNNNSGSSTLQLDGTTGNVSVSQDIALSGRTSAVVSIQNVAGTNSFAGDLLLNSGGANYWLQSDNGLLTFSGVLGIQTLTSGRTLTFQGVGEHLVSGVITNGFPGLTNANSVVKSGTGTLTLAGPNSYTGPTTVNAGKLFVNGVLGTNTVTVANTGTLGGNGLIKGAVTIQSGGTLAPGTSIGALTVSNKLTLSAGSTTRLEISGPPLTNDVLNVSGLLTYGGTLVVTNLAGPPASGDSFKLFNAGSYANSFAATNLPPLAAGLGWTFTSTNGVLSVVQTVATNPTNLAVAAADGLLTLSWPADHTGWRLQVQTNSVDTGLNSDWVEVPGSAATNEMVFPMVPANGSVFYRLVFP